MSNLFIKGTAIGFDYKKWKEDPELFSSLLFSVLQTWTIETYDNQNNLKIEIAEDLSRAYGQIKAAYFGLESDIHNLSINYHLMDFLIKNNDLDIGLKTMYISLLVENYIINLRSSYDFTSFFPKLLINPKYFKQLPTGKNADSLNSLINFCRKNETQAKRILSPEIVKLMLKFESDLEEIRKIRDAIIHKGKESIIEIINYQVFFRIPLKTSYGNENCLPDILSLGSVNYPLFDFLRALTIRLINYMEQLGILIIEELYKKNDRFKIELTALIGICIKDYLKFLYTDNE